MATYYNRDKSAIITDRDKLAAIEALLDALEESGAFTDVPGGICIVAGE